MKLRPEHILRLRPGFGANCSSMGSIVDTLFLGATAASALYAALVVALEEEAALPADEAIAPHSNSEPPSPSASESTSPPPSGAEPP